MTETEGSKVLFSGLNSVMTPLASAALVPLDEAGPTGELGRFSEALLLNDTVTIPVRGPALELVALFRWFGERDLLQLVEADALSFVFCPGTLAFVSERNKRALRVRMGPGIEHFVGENPAWPGIWESIEESVAFALHKQLDYEKAAARRIAELIGKETVTLPARESFEWSIASAYQDAHTLYGEATGMTSVEGWKRLDHERDRDSVRNLLDIASANLDLILASKLGRVDIVGNDVTWSVLKLKLEMGVKDGTVGSENLAKILNFEGLPDVTKMVRRGMQGKDVLRIRNASDSERFRSWLRRLPQDASEVDVLKAYYETFKRLRSESIPMKLLRFGLTTAAGVLHPLLGPAASVADSFMVGRLIDGWNPRVFIEKHFSYKGWTPR